MGMRQKSCLAHYIYRAMVCLAVMMMTSVATAQTQMVIYRDGKAPVRINVSEVQKVTWEDATVQPAEAVDLGLSVLWASYNLGATKAEEYGNYYAWGETVPKENYTEENYVAETSEKVICGTQYDAVAMLWGDEWSIPTIEQMEELTKQCTWTWTAMNGVNGYRVTGPSGANIFLPAAGQYRSSLLNVGSTGYYWSGTTSADYSTAAYNLNFSGYSGRWSANKSYGFSIRAVKKRD